MGFHTTDRLSAPGAGMPFRPADARTSRLVFGRAAGRRRTSTCRTGVALCLLTAVSFIGLAGCGGQSRAPAPPGGPPATRVELAVARQTPVDDASEYLATIQSMASTLVKPEVAGQLTRILVRSGDRVARGTPLFDIDPRRQEASVNTQDATLAAQQSAATLAQQQLTRAKTLFSAGAISKQELDQAQAAADSAEAQLTAQRARLQQERVTLQYYQVRAPMEGAVGDIPVRVGLYVTTDTVLTSVDRNQDLEVDVGVPIERSRDLRVGLPMRILDGQGRALAETTIFFVSPRVDDQTQSVLVKGRVPGSIAIRSQQFVRARIVWRTAPGLLVPLLSIVRVNGQPFVYVAREDRGKLVAEQRLVTLGDIVGNDVTVTEGLRPDERVVVSGVQKLANGSPIRPA